MALTINDANKFEYTGNSLTRPRTTFPSKFERNLSMQAGKLYPVFVKEMLPGDTLKLDLKALVRQNTMIFPVMDTAFVDVYAVKVPNRLSCAHWEEFFGENKKSYWDKDTTVYQPPLLNIPSSRAISATGASIDNKDPGLYYATDLLSYLNVPPFNKVSGTTSLKINAMSLAAYCQICNDWFRREVYVDPINFDGLREGQSSWSYQAEASSDTLAQRIQKVAHGSALYPVAKYRDMYTTALPEPQFGDPVTIPLQGLAPVFASTDDIPASMQNNPIEFKVPGSINAGQYYDTGLAVYSSGTGNLLLNTTATGTSQPTYNGSISPKNLWANLADATQASIQQLRIAVSTQRFKEILASGGTRYIETLFTLFGVRSSDARLQRSEFVGGLRQPVGVTSVAQTSMTAASGNTIRPLGQLGAYSVTGLDKGSFVNCSFEEHSIFMVVACIRLKQSYSQGLPPMYRRFDKLDYYNPCFANLGEMPVRMSEVYLTNTNGSNDDVFGYQESWIEYKTEQSYNMGLLNPALSPVKGGIGIYWNYGLVLNDEPTLNYEFILEDADNLERTLAVPGSYHFIAQFAFEQLCTREIPKYPNPSKLAGI